MRAGRLRHQVELLAQRSTRGAMGSQSDEWTPASGLLPASVEPLSGRELFSAQQHQAEVTTRVRIRYREGVSAGMKVLFRGRELHVLYVINPLEQNDELQLLCSEGVVAL